MKPRGIRANNPGNIKDNGISWAGLVRWPDRTDEQKDETTFCVFESPSMGIRAMAMILRNYKTKHRLYTINQIIHRWAPGEDNNDPDGYAAFVAKQMGVAADMPIDVEDFDTMHGLVRAIVKFENGQDPYDNEYIAGLTLAGIGQMDSVRGS